MEAEYTPCLCCFSAALIKGINAIRQTSVVIMKAKTADLTDTSIPKSKTEIAITAVSRMQQTTERPAALRRLLFQYVTRYATEKKLGDQNDSCKDGDQRVVFACHFHHSFHLKSITADGANAIATHHVSVTRRATLVPIRHRRRRFRR